MDLTPPHARKQEGGKEESESTTKKKKSKPESEKEETNLYAGLISNDKDEDEEDEEQDSLDDDGEDFDEEVPWYKKPIVIGIIIGGVLIALIAIYFLFIKEDPEPPPPPVESAPVEEAIDPAQVLKDELYKKGIGKEAVDEKNIYAQGNIESGDFRKDFVSTDAPESYVLPIEIMGVNDSVSYTKHRTMTDDGIDMYWVDAEYKGKKTRFTIPYYIWQTLAPQGVMDVVVETVIDAEGNTFVSSITAVPPSAEE